MKTTCTCKTKSDRPGTKHGLGCAISRERRARTNFLNAAPSCPMEGCGANVMRPKCFWELGGDCPRHAIRDKYEADADRRAK